MKKFLTLLFLAAFLHTNSQTLLSSFNLALRKPVEKQQVYACSDPNKKLFFTFASDKEKFTALKYNAALFVRDSISMPRPDTAFDFIAGSSLGPDGMPFIYWASHDFSKLKSVGIDFERRTAIEKTYAYSYDKETFLNAFSENGAFYMLTVFDEEQKLNLYVFKNGTPEVHTLDLSGFTFKTPAGKDAKLSQLLDDFPVEKMESVALNPLFTVVAKSKMYADGDSLWLTLDHFQNVTQAFQVSLSNFTVREFRVQQPDIPDANSSNSFYRKDRLYQLRASDTELVVTSKNIENPSDEIAYRFTENDTIVQKNSALLVQTGNQKPSALKTTKKFLRRLSGCKLGISVYESPDGLLVTSGGIRNVANTGNIILGATLGVGLAVSGSGSVYLADDIFDSQSSQQVFFESLFDENFNHLKKDQHALAVDFLSGFLAQHQHISTHHLTPFNDYFVFAYYDSKSKSVVLRKFSDARFEF